MRYVRFGALAVGFLCLTACTRTMENASSVTDLAEVSVFAMDTYMYLTAYGSAAETALAQAETRIAELENKWSVTLETSEIYAINHSKGTPVSVSDETSSLLRFSLDMSEQTDGALDCTLYPVLSAWGFTTGSYQIPSETLLAQRFAQTGYEKVQCNGSTVTLPEGMQIDLGAVAKGYVGDLLAEQLRAQHVTSALLDLGGNIQAVGTKPDGSAWRIGLRNPFSEETFAVLEVADLAVITSGGYERYFVGEDGETYWHILDPETGQPARSGLASVTIVGQEGRRCDALSTALFVMGREKAEALWRQAGDFEMVLVTDTGEVFLTEGLEDVFSLQQDYADMPTEIIRR